MAAESPARTPAAAPAANGHASSTAWRYAATAVLLVAAAAVIRLAASRGDLWLDEIWSCLGAWDARTALELYTCFPADNNHILNTLLLYWIGPHAGIAIYRLPAVLAGVATVGLAIWLGLRRNRPAGLFAGVLTGSSF